jgi:tRNA dimethylallyltransferase
LQRLIHFPIQPLLFVNICPVHHPIPNSSANFGAMPEIQKNKPILIVITGPTAIGKTTVSTEVARFFNTEIVSADSRQLYSEMSIGTAVPGQSELLEIKHHFIHSHSIHGYYNASRFEEEVIEKLKELFSSYNAVVMTGGSMLYIDAVCKGIDDLPAIDMQTRQNLIQIFETEGIESLRLTLKKLDPEYYCEVDLKNHKRLLHALEICIMTGKPYSSFRTQPQKERPFHILKIGLNTDRKDLYARINQRVDQMIAAGLEEEARNLFSFRNNNALNTVGYREWFNHFDGLISKEEAIEKIKSNTRRYARKQLTWFKRDQDITWFDISEINRIIPFIELNMNNLWNNPENL